MSVDAILLDRLRKTIASELGLEPERVYEGFQPRDLNARPFEVWIEPLEPRGAGIGVEAYPFALHLRAKAKRLPLNASSPADRRLRDARAQLRAALDGQRPYLDVLPQLIGTSLQGGDLGVEGETLDYELQLTVLLYD